MSRLTRLIPLISPSASEPRPAAVSAPGPDAFGRMARCSAAAAAAAFDSRALRAPSCTLLRQAEGKGHFYSFFNSNYQYIYICYISINHAHTSVVRFLLTQQNWIVAQFPSSLLDASSVCSHRGCIQQRELACGCIAGAGARAAALPSAIAMAVGRFARTCTIR